MDERLLGVSSAEAVWERQGRPTVNMLTCQGAKDQVRPVGLYRRRRVLVEANIGRFHGRRQIHFESRRRTS